MDVEFLAEGGVLEIGPRPAGAPLPAVPALLRADRRRRPPREATLAALRLPASRREPHALVRGPRRREPAARATRASRDVAELVEPGLGRRRARARIDARRAPPCAAAFEAVVAAGTIRALR